MLVLGCACEAGGPDFQAHAKYLRTPRQAHQHQHEFVLQPNVPPVSLNGIKLWTNQPLAQPEIPSMSVAPEKENSTLIRIDNDHWCPTEALLLPVSSIRVIPKTVGPSTPSISPELARCLAYDDGHLVLILTVTQANIMGGIVNAFCSPSALSWAIVSLLTNLKGLSRLEQTIPNRFGPVSRSTRNPPPPTKMGTTQ